MKITFRFAMAAVAISFVLAVAVAAQNPETKLYIDQLIPRSSTMPAGNVVIGLVNGQITYLALGAGLTVNPSTTPPTLNIPANPGGTPQIESYSYTASATTQVLKFNPLPNTLAVWRNGVLISSGYDYSVANGTGTAGATVTFNGGTPNNAPAAGDLFTFQYSH